MRVRAAVVLVRAKPICPPLVPGIDGVGGTWIDAPRARCLTRSMITGTAPQDRPDLRPDADPDQARDDAVAALRAFNREYTRLIGALDYAHRLSTPHSLPEARVLYELARREQTTATALRQELEMDPGQLSRVLSGLADADLVTRERDLQDTRRQVVRLTAAGSEAAALLDARSREAVGALLADLSPVELDRLLAAVRTVGRLLGGRPRTGSFTLRPPAPGDLGWILERHGALYAREFGWNERFEALVAEVVAEFAKGTDRSRAAGWIAEVGGERGGSVLCMDDGDGVARLRLLLVEPELRGLGIGAALVDRCVEFARTAGYRRLVLWTNDTLTAARRIYERTGFRLTASRPHSMFGPPMHGQDWAMDL